MDDEQFKHLTEPRDRRGERPQVEKYDINTLAEDSAFNMHCIWCQEANDFTPEGFALHRLTYICKGKSGNELVSNYERVVMPQALREVVRSMPLSLLDQETQARVVALARVDGHVWHYVRGWILEGWLGDPKPESLTGSWLDLAREMISHPKPPSRAKTPQEIIPDTLLATVATEIHYRYGFAPTMPDCHKVIAKAVGLSVSTVEDKIKRGRAE